MTLIIQDNILHYFDEVVVVVEMVRRFCCFVNSSVDEAELLSIENKGTDGSLILNVEVVL
jgi:hypothetical protein